MESDDLDRLFELYKEVVADGGAVPAGGSPTIDVFVEGWIRNRSVFVAWRDNEAVGTYFVRSNFPAFAAHIAQAGYIVARRARRSGIGTELLRHSLDQARDLGFSAMMFNLVLESNPSRRLYEAAGFTVVGQIPEAREKEPGLIYWRHL
jgi:L-amino acid N-acyltransferase YncA